MESKDRGRTREMGSAQVCVCCEILKAWIEGKMKRLGFCTFISPNSVTCPVPPPFALTPGSARPGLSPRPRLLYAPM